MSKRAIVGLMFVSFLIGDAEGVIRRNHTWVKEMQEREKEYNLLLARATALAEFAKLIESGVSVEEALDKLDIDAKFIDLTQGL